MKKPGKLGKNNVFGHALARMGPDETKTGASILKSPGEQNGDTVLG